MSLETDIKKDYYAPIVLVQYDITRQLTFTTTKRAFVYTANFNNEYDWISSSLLGSDSVLADIVSVGSVRIGGRYMTRVYSLSDCADNRESFYWNDDTKILYLHCPNGDDPDIFDIQIGVVYGFRKGGAKEYAYYNNIFYDDRIISIPKIRREKSDYYNSKNITEGGQITINNATDEQGKTYDQLAEDSTILGNAVRIYIGMEGYLFSEFELISVGYIKSIDVGTDTIIIEMKDKKERLSVPIPTNSYDNTDYPYLDDNNIGNPIPYRYGELRNVSIVCLNETEFDYDADNRPAPAETLSFSICDMTNHDAIYSVDNVYVDDGDGHKTDVTAHCTIDLATATFTLSSDYYVPGQTITADMKGYENADGDLIENALDIIKDLLLNHTNAKYNNIYFNTSKWDRSRAFNCAISVEENATLNDMIEEITGKGTLASFGIDDDDRYSCRILNTASDPNLIINEWDILERIRIFYDQDVLVSELRIKYNKDYANDKYTQLIDTAYKDQNEKEYQTYNRKEIETLFPDETNAQAFADAFGLIYGVPYKTFEILTGLIGIKSNLSDIIKIELKRPYAPNIGIVWCEVIWHEKDFDMFQVRHGLRIFKLELPQTWSDGSDWYSDDWYSDDWAVGMYVDDLTA